LLATHIIIDLKKIVQLECILSLTKNQVNVFYLIKSNVNDTLNNDDNFENFENTCINTAIDTISATIASTSKNEHHRVPAATFDACKLLISNKKRNRQEIKENEEILEQQPRKSNRNKISN